MSGRPSSPGRPWVALGGDALKSLLAAPVLAKTTHFVLHAGSNRPSAQQLPTDTAPDGIESVDNQAAPTGLALVVPKRHAKRAATRNLVKRQMREALSRRLARWRGVQLLIRQRGAFEATRYPSAASRALRAAVSSELDQLFDQAAAR
jgi:ribonuclease P protein component